MSVARASKYAQVAAAVRAMKSDILDESGYERLMRTSSLIEAANVLIEFRRGSSVRLTENELDLAQLESALRNEFITTIRRLVSYSPRACAELIERMLQKYEFESLKSLLRGLHAEAEQALRTVVPSPRFPLEFCRDILESKNVARLVESIGVPSLTGPLSSAIGADQPLQVLESVVDQYTYLDVWRATSFLGKGDQESARSLIGDEIDTANILLTLRSKGLGLDARETKRLLVPINHRLGPTLEEAVEGGSVAASLRAFSKSAHGPSIAQLAAAHKEGDPVFPFELALKRSQAARCLRLFEGFPFVAGLPIAFVYIKGYETGDLISILTGKQDQIPTGAIEKFLVLHELQT